MKNTKERLVYLLSSYPIENNYRKEKNLKNNLELWLTRKLLAYDTQVYWILPSYSHHPYIKRIGQKLVFFMFPMIKTRPLIQVPLFYLFSFLALLFISFRTLKPKTNAVYVASGASATLPSYLVARLLNRRVIGKLYGTFLYYDLFLFKKVLKSLPEILAFKLPLDFYIISDDSTRGDRVAMFFGKRPLRDFVFLKESIDCGRIIPEPKHYLSSTEKEVSFIAVSRLVSWKRIDLVIESFSVFLEKYIFDQSSSGHTNWPKTRLYIVGDGPERQRLMKLVLERRLRDYVVFTGALPNESVLDLMRESNILLSFQDYTPLSRQVVEALCLGLIVVVRNTGDASKVIKDGVNGFIVNSENPSVIAKKMKQILESRDSWEEISKKAVETCVKLYGCMERRYEREARLIRVFS